jgi:hypothetical protein
MLKEKALGDLALMPFMPLVSDVIPGSDGKTFFEMQVLNRQSYSCENYKAYLDRHGLEQRVTDERMFARYVDFIVSKRRRYELSEEEG